MSDYFNSFANPQGGGGQDIPQPGTPAFYQWLQSLAGQGQPQPGGPPGPLAANPANLPASPNMANMKVVGLPSSSGFTLPDGTPAPVAADASLVHGGVSQGAHAAPPPPQSQPVAAASVKQPQQQKPPAKRAPPAGPLAAQSTTSQGGGYGASAPPGLTSYVDDSLFEDRSPDSTTSQGGGYAAPAQPDATPDASINAHIAMGSGAYGVPGSPSTGATPNLGYYRPTSGDVRGGGWGQPGPTWMQYGANDPRMFRGPLASQPTAAAAAPPPPAAPAAAAGTPGPIAPGVGTLWLRKLFGGGQPTAA